MSGRVLRGDEIEAAAVALAIQLGASAADSRFAHLQPGRKDDGIAGDAPNVVKLPTELVLEPPAGSPGAARPGPTILHSGWTSAELAPDAFAKVRLALGLSSLLYRSKLALPNECLDGTQPLWPTLLTFEGAGKSGASFFASSDHALLAKSCTRAEVRTLLRMLPAYIHHISTSPGGHTLLQRFYGLFRVRDAAGRTVGHYLVSENFFASAHALHRRFDLKGSTVGRRAASRELAKGKLAVLKDLDWVAAGARLDLGVGTALLLSAIEADVAFLRSQGVIDYSLLVGLTQPPPKGASAYRQGETESPTSCASSSPCAGAKHEEQLATGGACLLGIVDVLVSYGWRKRLETALLSTAACGRDISCQPPRKYASRFVAFMSAHVFAAATEEPAGAQMTVSDALLLHRRGRPSMISDTSEAVAPAAAPAAAATV